VILEQPELHLHPAVQARLADVILEAALVRNVQVIVESHSEHLLRRIQLRVAEERLENGTQVAADDVRLWFIDQPGRVSVARDLQLNGFGEIANWPDNFFGDPFGETARIAQAGLRRRRNKAS
jgi:predicted ATPase